MKVFQVRLDVNHYQYFLTEREEDQWLLYMDGRPKAESWIPPEVFVLNPRRIAGDFYQFNNSLLIASPFATEVLGDHFRLAGEILPIPYQGNTFAAVNITERVAALDEKRTEWIYGQTTGARIGIKKYAFHPDRFPDSTLFKMQWGTYGEVLIIQGANDMGMDFRKTVEEAGLKGLILTEIWSDEG